MADRAESRVSEWFQVTENLGNWENQIKKLKEDLSELSDGELEFDIVKPHRIEEEALHKI